MGNNKSVSPLQFWIGIGVTIVCAALAAGISFWQTRLTIESSNRETLMQIAADRNKVEEERASLVLRDITLAATRVGQYLDSFASYYLELESCLAQLSGYPVCANREYAFDSLGAQSAWASLDVNLNAASPLLVDTEVTIINRIRDLKKAHQKDIASMLPAKSVKGAQSIRLRISKTHVNLEDSVTELNNTVSGRVRGAR